MIQIHRKQIEKMGVEFLGPKNVTLGWQQDRSAFSIWYLSGQPFDTEYIVTGTGIELPGPGIIRASIVMPDGFHVFHLVEIKK